jgi:regulator of RNase E activity RraA
MPITGNRINPAVTPVPSALIEAFREVVTPHISDNLGRHIGARGLTRLNKTGKLVGTALTVKTRPGDNLLIYKAMQQLQPGHVLVIDAEGDVNNAVIGELVKLYADMRGCVGYVVDGAIRDVVAFEHTPLYARAVIHCGPRKDGPGEVNVPVSIGGMIVNPGDIIVGDEDGVVAVPREQAEEVLRLAALHAEHEQRVMAEIATGEFRQSWMESALKARGLLD